MSRSTRSFADAAQDSGIPEGQGDEGTGVNMISGDPDVTESALENAAAESADGVGTGQAGNGSQSGGTEPEEPEQIVTPLDVVQMAKRWEDDVLQISFAVLLDDDPATTTPNGLIVSQQIPEGWEIVQADPQAQMLDEDGQVVKWLFVGESVANSSIHSFSVRAPSNQIGNWNETLAWYTYRMPDGQCVDVSVVPYPGSDIQPQ